MKHIILVLCLPLYLFSEEYKIGYGYKINDYLHISGYLSTQYCVAKNQNQIEFDDLALLAYSNLSPKLSYFFELEGSSIYTYDFNTKVTNKNALIHAERLYLDYKISNHYNIRIGKQITPIGYWNYQPINVLRDTTSNPVYASKMFPKLLSGIDLYGNVTDDNHFSYHLFIQATKGLNDETTNIKSEHFYGLSLDYAINENTSIGGAIGNYKIRQTNQAIKMLQMNAKYRNNMGELQTEFAYNTTTKKTPNIPIYNFSGYIQGKYNINEEHSLISRYEYIDNNHINHIATFGYSYRPTYAISVKAEYQLESTNRQNKALVSFSILF